MPGRLICFKNGKEFLLFVKPTADESTKYIAQLLSNTSHLSDYSNDDLEKVLRYFFTALKKEEGSDYTGDSIFCHIMWPTTPPPM